MIKWLHFTTKYFSFLYLQLWPPCEKIAHMENDETKEPVFRRVRDGDLLRGCELHVCNGIGPGEGALMFAIDSFHIARVELQGDTTILTFQGKLPIEIHGGVVIACYPDAEAAAMKWGEPDGPTLEEPHKPYEPSEADWKLREEITKQFAAANYDLDWATAKREEIARQRKAGKMSSRTEDFLVEALMGLMAHGAFERFRRKKQRDLQ